VTGLVNSPYSREEHCCKVQAGQGICPPISGKGNRTGDEQAASSCHLPSNVQARSNLIGTAVCSGREPPSTLIIRKVGTRKGRGGRPSSFDPLPRRGAGAPGHVAEDACEAAPGGRRLYVIRVPTAWGDVYGYGLFCTVPSLVYLASDERNSKRWLRRGVWILELGTRAAAASDVLTVGYLRRRAAAASCGLGYVTWAHKGNLTPH
jgi:hypothetical protein